MARKTREPLDEISREEWNFKPLTDDQVEECWNYEFARQCRGLCMRIKAWRMQVSKQGDLFEAYRRFAGGNATPFIQIADHLFMIPPGAYYLFPEWPATPYLKIEPGKRRKRLERLWNEEKGSFPLGREIVPHPAEYELDFSTADYGWNKDAWERFTKSVKEEIIHSNTLRAFRGASDELMMFRIRWDMSDKNLLDSIHKWLSANRPKKFEKLGSVGRSNPLPKRRKQLEQLGKYRIVQQNKGVWRIDWEAKELFSDQSQWIKCRKSVEGIMAELESLPGCQLTGSE
jgi:hypothetical protein